MQEVFVESFDATKLFFNRELVEDARAAIVIVHGLCEHQGRYDYFAEKLHQAGISTYRFDHRGHGRSEGERTYYSDFNEILDDTNVFVDLAIKENPDIAEKTLFTGMIDEYFGYKLGALEYRSVRFETEVLETDNYQGNAVVNYTEREVPYTRIIEHKHFEFGKQEKTVISKEYSSEWKVGMEPYYPVNNEQNNKLFEEYRKLAEQEKNVIFGGRLGNYKYYDMDKVIEAALEMVAEEL